MPVLGAGSVADILKLKHPEGIKDEAVLATIIRDCLLGLKYFHDNG
jgi:hypothetical protein